MSDIVITPQTVETSEASAAEISIAAVAETAEAATIAEAAAETATDAAREAIASSQDAIGAVVVTMDMLTQLRSDLDAHIAANQLAHDGLHDRLVELEDAEDEPEAETDETVSEPAAEEIELVQPEAPAETAPTETTKRRKFRKL